jgi:hypothetical protein
MNNDIFSQALTENLIDAILQSSNLLGLPIVEDNWSGSIFVELPNGDALYCTPNWEGAENQTNFQHCVWDNDGYEYYPNMDCQWTGDVEQDLCIWLSAVLIQLRIIQTKFSTSHPDGYIWLSPSFIDRLEENHTYWSNLGDYEDNPSSPVRFRSRMKQKIKQLICVA